MQKEDNAESPNLLTTKKSNAPQGTIVVTLGDILKFALFFIICFLVVTAAAEWLA